MDTQGKIIRAGAAAIMCALLVGLIVPIWKAGGFWSVVVFLQTGRIVAPLQETVTTPTTVTEPEIAAPVLSTFDAERILLNNTSGYDVDVSQLLAAPLPWQQPTVLILHTHGTESYTKTEDYTESSSYRTQDTGYNVVSVGDRLATILEENGLRVIHDRAMHDLPSYDAAYIAARNSIQTALALDPSVCLVIDLHRDAALDDAGSPVGETVSTHRGEAAPLMFVMGTDAGGYEHPRWRDNLSVAVKLQAQLETVCPGICRPIQLRASRYNQDLSPGALLVEVGFTGNDRQEALLAAEFLAQAIINLSASP